MPIKVPPELIESIERAIVRLGRKTGRIAEEVKPGIGLRPGSVPLEAGTELATRATKVKEHLPVVERLGRLGKLAGAFTRNEAELDPEARTAFADARSKWLSAEENARLDVEDAVTKHISTDPVKKATLLSDLMTTAHEIAIHPLRMKRLREATGDVGTRFINDYDAKVHPGGLTIGQLTRNMIRINEAVKAEPEVLQAHQGARKLLDETFADMVNRGALSADRYVHEYTPIEKLELVTGVLGITPTQKAGGRVTSAMKGLTAEGQALRETDVLRTIVQARSAWYRKVAEDELVQKILDNPQYNLTDQFQPHQPIPKGLSIWRPGVGMPGYGKRPKAEEFADGFIDEIHHNDPTFEPGDYVVPTEIAEALSKFRPQRLSRRAQSFADLGAKIARLWTVYNPTNTVTNLPGDILISTASEGSAKNALGFLRVLGTTRPWKEAVNVAIGKRTALADEFRRKVGGTTLISDIGGVPVPSEFSRFYQKPIAGLGAVKNTMKKIRYGSEAVPRIAEMIRQQAAGVTDKDAIARSARRISLEYGSGAPDVARNPYAKFLSTFIQFYGLATERTLQLLGKKGSAAVLAAVPTGFMLWNYQNEEYAKAENSLADWERSQLHTILPGPDGKPMLDDKGKPVVVRFRWWIPEQVLNTFGLGNIPSRVRRVVEGRTTPSEFLASIPQQAGQNISRLGGVLETARQVASGTTPTGQTIEGVKGAARAISPQVRQIDDAIRVARNEGTGKGALKLVASTLGISFATVRSRGKVLLDTDIQNSKKKMQLYVSRMKFARMRQQKADYEDAKKALINERKTLQRLRSIQRNED